MAVDGPKGPFGVINEGAMQLSRLSGAPVVPLLAVAKRVGKLKDPVAFPKWAYQILHRRGIDWNRVGLGEHDFDQALQGAVFMRVEDAKPIDFGGAPAQCQKATAANAQHGAAGHEAHLQKPTPGKKAEEPVTRRFFGRYVSHGHGDLVPFSGPCCK